MSGLFPHRVVKEKEGFVFIVLPADDTDADSISAASEVEGILQNSWSNAASGLSVAEVSDPEEAELIYADVVQLLADEGREESDQIIVSGVIVVGKLVVVTCMLIDEDLAGDDDDSTETSEEDFA